MNGLRVSQMHPLFFALVVTALSTGIASGGDADLEWSTFLGGIGEDTAAAIAVDGAGNVYVAGTTVSSDFPTSPGAFDTSYNAWDECFVTKLNDAGTAIIYSTLMGGSSSEGALAIALDSSGNAYITGETYSSDFPTKPGAFDISYNGFYDCFAAKLNNTGTDLVYSTYLGGGNSDKGAAIVVDSMDHAYIAGETYSSDFPTTAGSYDTSYNGYFECFVMKINTTGTDLVYSTYLGGFNSDRGKGIALDSSGNVYVTGETFSPDFPTTPGAFDTSFNGGWDAFVTKLNDQGSALDYSTVLGGGGYDHGFAIALDSSESPYIAGTTSSSNFPITDGAHDSSHEGSSEGFATKISPSGNALVYSTFLGGNGSDDSCLGIAVNSLGKAYVTGYTTSSDFAMVPNSYDTSYNGGQDAFVVILDQLGSSLDYSTFLGGSNAEESSCIALSGSGNVHVAGFTNSTGFPVTLGSYDTSYNSNTDAFVAKFDILFPPATPTPAIPPTATPTSTPEIAPGAWESVSLSYASLLGGKDPMLRVFRDNYLREIPGGNALVRVFYANLPWAAELVNRDPLARATVWVALVPSVPIAELLASH